jgi:hypothetical protein
MSIILNNETVSATGYSSVFKPVKPTYFTERSRIFIESASGLTAELHQKNPATGNFLPVTDNGGTKKTFTANGTYDFNNTPDETEYKFYVTAGSANFTVIGGAV